MAVFKLATFFLVVVLLTGCLDEGVSVDLEEFEDLVGEKMSLEEDLEEAYEQLDDYEAEFADFEKMQEDAKALAGKSEEVESLKENEKRLEEELRLLRQERDDYQKKYETKVREDAIGEEFVSLKVGNRVLEQVILREISATKIRVEHKSGFTVLDHRTAPKEWKERFFIRSKEEVAERANSAGAVAAATVDDEDSKSSEEVDASAETSKVSKSVVVKEPSEADLNRILRDVTKSVVIISGDGGQGTGFFAQDGSQTYLYTAAHVLDRNSNLKIVDSTGKEWRDFGDFEVAKDLDLVRLEVNEPVDGGLIVRPVQDALEIGLEVAAFGNANGGGVVTREKGELKGVGANSYEISAAVLQGNSGGPVVTNNGEVVAVVTHLLSARDDIWAEGTASASVRRFACRLDANVLWVKQSLGRFVVAQTKIDEYDRITKLLFALSALTPTAEGLTFKTEVGGSQTVLDILQENRSLKVVKDLMQMNEELTTSNTRVSESDLRRRFRSLCDSTYNSAKRQTLAASDYSPFHQGEVEGSIEFRDRAITVISEAIRNLR